MKKIAFLLLIGSCTACNFAVSNSTSQAPQISAEISKDSINLVLEQWHAAAANANFDEYFRLMAKNGIFIGTDATENWQNAEFREFAKPYFDKGKAWSFSTLERNIYTSNAGGIAWFDELLDTQMGICRGSGVLEKINGEWKIKHYVLSIAVPNEHVPEVTRLKKEFDENLISNYNRKP